MNANAAKILVDLEEYKCLQAKNEQLQSKVSSKTETILKLGKALEAIQDENKLMKARSLTLERNLQNVELELHKYAAFMTMECHVRQLLAVRDLPESTKCSQKMEPKNEVDIKNSFKLERERLLSEVERLQRELQATSTENAELKAEKNDLQKDCKLFRQQIAKFEIANLEGITNSKKDDNTSMRKLLAESGAEDLGMYEKLYKEFKQIETDLHTVLGIKEELVLERDALLKKVDRLSTELSYLLNGDPRRVAEDLDSLVAENRFLKARLDSANEESETMRATLSKYRATTESGPSSANTMGSPDSSLGARNTVAVVNMKQIRELLSSQSIELDDNDYRAITAILLDLCNDKQMALTHLRRANKVLGNRVSEVESHLAVLEAKSRSTSPSKPSDA